MTVVGVVGLGAMGSRFAGRLLEAGHEVHGTNRSPAKAADLIERGLVWHDSPREVADAVDVVVSMVSNDSALEAITSGPDGIFAGLTGGKVYVDMSTVSPEASRAAAEHARATGADMLDAPVSGSIPQAEAGTLTIMAGGADPTFARVEPLLRELGQTVRHVGDNGAGLVLKLAINISLAVQTLAFSEGLLLAERGGIDPVIATDVMGSSQIGSPMLRARVPLLLHLPDHAWFTISLLRKDIGLALQEAERKSLALPSTTTAAQMLDAAVAGGYADADIAALRRALDGNVSSRLGRVPA